jgi:hypothetical protein
VRLQSESFVLQGFLIWVTSFTLCFLDQWWTWALCGGHFI